jgi:hypothetical protein
VSASCGAGFTFVVVTYNHDTDMAGSAKTNEPFYVFAY